MTLLGSKYKLGVSHFAIPLFLEPRYKFDMVINQIRKTLIKNIFVNFYKVDSPVLTDGAVSFIKSMTQQFHGAPNFTQ